jgi:tetratricopeptide (TPR) repeat protein
LLAGDSRRAADALPHAERYWKEFANDSSLNHRMAIAQMSAFAAVGRADQGMEQLRTAIVATAKAAKSEELLPLVGAYADAYLIHHDADQFATHVESICQLDPTNRMLQSSLQLAVIDTYEALAKSATDDRRQQAATAALKNRIQRFKREFAVKELSNRDLLRLGDFLYLRMASPKEAVSCYNEVISRGDARLRFPALLGRGDIGSRSRVPAEIQASLADFSTVYQDSLDRAERDYALFRMIGLLNGLGDHEKALEQALIYLNNSEGSYLDFIPEVEGLQAQSLASLERYDEAIAVYSRLWGLHRDHLTLSAPAMLHWMQLNWHHAPADRSATCEAASQYIEQTRPSKEMAPPAWGQITELLLSYRQTLADASATLSPSEE